MQTMHALVFRTIGKIEPCEVPIPEVTQPDDVLIKVSSVGICGSDLKILEGKHHFKENTVLGHEFCGKVVEIGSHVSHFKLGDRVCVDNNMSSSTTSRRAR